MELEKRVGLVEEAILLMKGILVSHSERLDDYYLALGKSREDFEFKMNALIDSQIKTEMELRQVKESIIELRGASQSQLSRIEKLEQN
jgi:hypothetical protein